MSPKEQSQTQPPEPPQTQNSPPVAQPVPQTSPLLGDNLEQELEEQILEKTKQNDNPSIPESDLSNDASEQVSPTLQSTKTSAPQPNISNELKGDSLDEQTEQEIQQEQTLAELEKAINGENGDNVLSPPIEPRQSAPNSELPNAELPQAKTSREQADLHPEIESKTSDSTPSNIIPKINNEETFIPQTAVNSEVQTQLPQPVSSAEGQPAHSNIQSPATDSLVRPLRTYRDDVARAIREKNSSMVSIISAETERRNRSLPEDTHPVRTISPRFYLFVTIGALLFGTGAAILMWTLLIRPAELIPIPASSVPAYIFAEEQRPLEITDRSSSEITTLLYTSRSAVNPTLGAITQLYFVEKVETNNPEEPTKFELVKAGRLFDLIGMRTPASLVRSIDNHIMFGFHAFDGTQPFLIFKTSLYENAFAGMLEWEQTFESDISRIFALREAATSTTTPQDNNSKSEERVADTNVDEEVIIEEFFDEEIAPANTVNKGSVSEDVLDEEIAEEQVAEEEIIEEEFFDDESVGEEFFDEESAEEKSFAKKNDTAALGALVVASDLTTAIKKSPRPFVAPFRDKLVRNQEARVLEDENGDILLMYAFPNRETIVITNNEFTFIEIIARLNAIQI